MFQNVPRYALSKGLLEAVRPHEWGWCVETLSRGGGDVRVGVCVVKWLGFVDPTAPWPLPRVANHREISSCDRADRPV